MNTTLIIERLDRIEKKIDGKPSNRYLDIQKVAEMLSISVSSIEEECVAESLNAVEN